MTGGGVKVRIEGLRETQEALRSMFPDNKARSIMRRVLRKAAKPIAADAAAKAPVDPTGQQDLKNSIAVSGTLAKSQRAQSGKKDPSDVVIYVGASTKNTRAITAYAHLQEFGSSVHGPSPYMRPAWDAARSNIIRNIGKDLWDEIEKSLKRAARKAAKAAGGL